MYFLIAVLAYIIQNVSVVKGERATFACEGSRDIINWSVGDMIFDECEDNDVAPDGNGCYTNDTHSVLVINTLAPGTYPVHMPCILQQNIPDNFKNDPSFQENFNNITRSASLTIIGKLLKIICVKQGILYLC